MQEDIYGNDAHGTSDPNGVKAANKRAWALLEAVNPAVDRRPFFENLQKEEEERIRAKRLSKA